MATEKSIKNVSQEKANEIKDKLIALIKDEIESRNLVVTHLANQAGVKPSTITRWLDGTRTEPELIPLLKVLSALDIELTANIKKPL